MKEFSSNRMNRIRNGLEAKLDSGDNLSIQLANDGAYGFVLDVVVKELKEIVDRIGMSE